MDFTEDFSISRDMCSMVLSDVQRLLDIARKNGGSQNEFPGATYLTRSLSKSLKEAQLAPAPTSLATPRRPTKALTQQAKKRQQAQINRLKRKQQTIDAGESTGPSA